MGLKTVANKILYCLLDFTLAFKLRTEGTLSARSSCSSCVIIVRYCLWVCLSVVLFSPWIHKTSKLRKVHEMGTFRKPGPPVRIGDRLSPKYLSLVSAVRFRSSFGPSAIFKLWPTRATRTTVAPYVRLRVKHTYSGAGRRGAASSLWFNSWKQSGRFVSTN
jgi:hypothetical protein